MEKNTMYAKFRVKLNHEEDVHKLPLQDVHPHQNNINCDCRPYQDPENVRAIRNGETDRIIWVHRIIADREGVM